VTNLLDAPLTANHHDSTPAGAFAGWSGQPLGQTKAPAQAKNPGSSAKRISAAAEPSTGTGAQNTVPAGRPTRASRAPGGPESEVLLLRNKLGEVLRTNRLRQRRTLRDVAKEARVSLGYLSEVERGQKEASSELLASICQALDIPLWATLREVADRMSYAAKAAMPNNQMPDLSTSYEDAFLTSL
jgi:transcriptional regulator with XRE-family HTH domain